MRPGPTDAASMESTSAPGDARIIEASRRPPSAPPPPRPSAPAPPPPPRVPPPPRPVAAHAAPTGAPVPHLPPPGAVATTDGRPWWGMGDILLGVPFILVVAAVATVAGLIGWAAFGDSGTDAFDDAAALPTAVLVAGLLGQQAAQGIWPFIVLRWKGRSRHDFGFSFEKRDLLIGPLAGLGMVVAAGLVSAILAALVGLDDPDAADNAGFLADADGTVWQALLVLAVVVGAPFTEEFFFRGLTLRAVQKRMGPWWGLAISSLFFCAVHWQPTSADGLVVLLGTIGLVGTLLGVLALYTGRVASSILAHVVFNLVGVIVALNA